MLLAASAISAQIFLLLFLLRLHVEAFHGRGAGSLCGLPKLILSLDGGLTWRDHRVVSDLAKLTFTTIREISPGRLFYTHDGRIPGTLARISLLCIDVERAKT